MAFLFVSLNYTNGVLIKSLELDIFDTLFLHMFLLPASRTVDEPLVLGQKKRFLIHHNRKYLALRFDKDRMQYSVQVQVYIVVTFLTILT